MAANFFTIPSDFDFLDMLARRLLVETSNNPLGLKDYGIILPDRLSCDIFKQKLQDLNEGRPLIMPQVVTLEGFDNDVLPLRLADDEELVEKLSALSPPVSKLERELYLTREILKHPETADSLTTAVGLARELAQFIDELHRAAVPLEKLSEIDAGDFPGDLVKTRNILKIVTDIWPKIKADMGVLDREERQQKILGVLTEYATGKSLKAPLIFAGFNRVSDGMTRLLSALARGQSDNIRIVFQGLDVEMGKSWQTIDPSHPQYAHKKLLEDMKVARSKVGYWPGTTPSTHSQRAKERLKLLREAMRPSESTHKWKDLKIFNKSKLRPSAKVTPEGSPLSKRQISTNRDIDPIALTGMDLVVAGTQQEEASIIALKLREMLETENMTGALITPDRALAARVAARLQYWNITVAPEEGTGLIGTSLGRFMVHVAEMAVSNLAPIPLLETLKSPFAGFGKSITDTRMRTAILEDMVLRGPRPWPGFKGLKKSLAASFNEVSGRMKSSENKASLQKDYDGVSRWLNRFEKNSRQDCEILSSSQPQSFKTLLTAHIRLMETLAKTHKTGGADILWSGTAGHEAQKLLSKLLKASDILPEMTGSDYLQLIKSQIRDCRYTCKTHPRIRIIQPDKAHLFRPDLNIVAGLSAANWPGKQTEKFWLSPELRKNLGLPPIETEIGYAGFDFVQGVSNKNTIMTRAERDQNAPCVSSPFLTRLEMLLKGLGLEDKLKPKSQILEINAALHRPAKVTPIAPPAPTPPESARPRRFSVSAIEKLLRDPYTVYARHVLKLYPKDPIDADPSYGERGDIIHGALDEFKRRYPNELPKNAEQELLKIGKKSFEKRMDNPSVRAFWWPRFERMAEWFVKYEKARADFSTTLKTEVHGKLNLDTEKGRFVLTAIADRIDALMDDSLSIIDYKTGTIPSKKDVANGLSPQLTLEALIALSGGFEGIDAKKVGMLEYWKLSGGRPAGQVSRIEDIDQLQVEALEGLTRLLQYFADEKTPYLPTPRPAVAPRYVPYDHLARSDEWGHDVSKKQAVERDLTAKPPRKAEKKSAKKSGGPKK